VTILDDSIVPAGVNIPENTVYGGKPARFIRAACDMHEFEIQQHARMIYDNMYSAITDYVKLKTK
jgi:carbonic anhydrase/acetyltransferase-like protein (isoleucine patch superfamily)